MVKEAWGLREIVGGDRFEELLDQAAAAKKGEAEAPRAYIGFEPSGTAHVGWIVCARTVQNLADAGFHVSILLADWHAQINDKLGGDLDNIQACGRYMMDAFEALGVDPNRVEYVWASDLADDADYWATVMRVAKATSLARVRRAMDIMGRSADEAEKDLSKFLYPAMQVADIFYMDMDLAYGGMDQRHAHMLARDVAKKVGAKSPVAIHTPLVPNLKGGQGRMDPVEIKMSKSDPNSGIFLHDEASKVQKKINKAHCPQGTTEDNPVWDLLTMVIWPALGGPFTIDRPEKFGGPLSYETLESMKLAFEAGELHPMDLKMGVGNAMNQILEPVRQYFDAKPASLELVESFQRTR